MPDQLSTPEYLRLSASLDPLDRQIVSLLQADGRLPFSHIARELGITEKTARSRVLELIDQGVMQITAVTDPSVLGYGAAALLGIVTKPDHPASGVAQALQKIASVDYAVVTASRYSIFVELLCRDRAAMQRVIEDEVGKVDGILSFEVLPYLSLHYQNAHFASARAKAQTDAGVRPRQIDETDVAIIRALSEDGRKPFMQIASEIGVSEALVRARFKHLTDNGTVGVIALINPMGLEYRSMAWLAINVAPGHSATNVADTLAALPNTTYIAICSGRFDIMTEIICQTEKELLDLIDTHIRSLPSISRIETSIYIELYYKRLIPIRD